jgi:hypothetical protein
MVLHPYPVLGAKLAGDELNVDRGNMGARRHNHVNGDIPHGRRSSARDGSDLGPVIADCVLANFTAAQRAAAATKFPSACYVHALTDARAHG